MVTFNVLTIANTFRVKEDIEIDFAEDNCTDVYHETYKEFQDLGLGHDASKEAFSANKDCKGI